MAIISRTDLLNQLLPGLNKVFDEVYATHTSNEQYMVEVEFDGQDELRNNRNDDGA
jgi:hypothetical protein